MRVARGRGRTTPKDLFLLAVAGCMLLRTRLALWWLPWSRLLTRPDPPGGAFASRVDIRELEWSVRAASRVLPHGTCLAQAIALNHLLHRAGYLSVVHIGVTNTGGRFAAHAWVEYEGSPLLSSRDEIAQYVRFMTWPPAQPDPCT